MAFYLCALLRRIVRAIVVVADAFAHVVHGRGGYCLYAAVAACRRDGHARKTADTHGADLSRVNEFQV